MQERCRLISEQEWRDYQELVKAYNVFGFERIDYVVEEE